MAFGARLRRPLLSSAAVLTTLALVAGCGSSDASSDDDAKESAGSITFTDQRGVEITLDGPAERIAAPVMPAPALIAAVDGSWDRIAGMNQSLVEANKNGIISKIFPESVTTPVIAGADFMPNMEEILSLDSDLVVQWGDMGSEILAPIESAGIPVAGLEYGTQEDLEKWITLFGTAIGKTDRAEQMISTMHDEAADIKEEVAELKKAGAPDQRAMTLAYTDEALTVSTGADYTQYVYDLVGLTNVAEGAKVSNGVASPEQILEWDPEIIFLSVFSDAVPEDIYSDPRFADLSAVKNKRVYRSPLGVYRWQVPTAESALYWNWVAGLAYPGKFEADLPEEMREQISFLYNYDLTEADIERILATDVNGMSADYDAVTQ